MVETIKYLIYGCSDFFKQTYKMGIKKLDENLLRKIANQSKKNNQIAYI